MNICASPRRSPFAGFLALGAAVGSMAVPSGAATFTVSSTNDSGRLTLREAITNANLDAVRDEIVFALTGGSTITLATALPQITQPVFINGYSQPGSVENNLSNGTDARPVVELAGPGSGIGLDIAAGNSVVRGLTIGGFGTGVRIAGAGSVVGGSFIGTNVTGTAARSNNIGVFLDGQGHVGGPTDNDSNGTDDSSAADNRNVISGNTVVGVRAIASPNGSTVVGNMIGTNAFGTSALPNGFGVDAINCGLLHVGTSSFGEGNVISGNTGGGVYLETGNTVRVMGNAIGVGVDGATAIPNGGNGVELFDCVSSQVGGDATEGNVISANNGDGVLFDQCDSSSVSNNFIGTTDNGTLDRGNRDSGVRFRSTGQSSIGFVSGGNGEGNIISGNGGDGILIEGPAGTNGQIMANFIGIANNGTALPNDGNGIRIGSGVVSMDVGGPGNGRNYISGNGAAGIQLDGTSNGTVVANNFIGVDSNGDAPLPNGTDGINIASNTNFIGNNTAAGRNLISGNAGTGISITGSGNQILGNLIGTNEAGDAAVPNGDGVRIEGAGATDNVIGGGAIRNVISSSDAAFTGYGVYIAGGASDNEILGCFIGTNAQGTALLPNKRGVVIENAGSNFIGSETLAGRNVIAGGEYGILISGATATDNLIRGNHIGTNFLGTASLPNDYGIGIFGNADDNTIGGDDIISPGVGNLIAGNVNNNILIDDSDRTLIYGNRIGTREDGLARLGTFTTSAGIQLDGATQRTELGGAAGLRNVISGHANHGILITGNGTSLNNVLGNYIGVGEDGTTAVPNDGSGVVLIDGASGNFIGTPNLGHANTIANNGRDGVTVHASTPPAAEPRGNSIRGNSIFSNAELGINLQDNGEPANFRNPNDPGDADDGPNGLQNAPVVTVTPNGANLTVRATLQAVANAPYILDLYRSNAASAAAAEGETYVDSSATTTTSGAGSLAVTFTVPAAGGPFFTATAVSGNRALPLTDIHETSEFSPAVRAGAAPLSLVVTTTANAGAGSLRQAILNANAGSGTRTITFNLPPGQAAGGVWTISPLTELPALTTNSVTIEGGTQTAFGGNTNSSGPEVVLRGSTAGFAGLTIRGNNNAVRNLVINNFTGTGKPDGIVLEGAATGNRIESCYIGTNPAGTGGVPNQYGVYIAGTAHDNVIGGLNANQRNIIAFNNLNGILNSSSGRGNAFLGNRIFSNGRPRNGLGIDLSRIVGSGDGVNPNDGGPIPDQDPGPNDLQNFPILLVNHAAGTVTITGAVISTPNTDFRVEYFSSSQPSNLRYGEGENFLGFQNVRTGADGRFKGLSFSAPVPAGHYITSTATRRNAPMDTSEFSLGIRAGSVPPTRLTISVAPVAVNENAGAAAATATVTLNAPAPAPFTVLIASNDTSEARVPVSGTVVIPTGATTVQFPVAAMDDTIVDGDMTVKISARATGISAVTANLTVRDNDVIVPGGGGLLAWGYNEFGQIGDNSTAHRSRPVRVSGFGPSDVVAAGGGHSLAATFGGAAHASGYNVSGQLGDGSTQDKRVPVMVNGLSGVRSLAAGWYHSVAVRNDGTVWTWGYNGAGQLGNNSTQDRTTPVQVAGLSNITAVAAGTYHSVALQSDGTVWTWGNNFYGQLGDRTTTDRHRPVRAIAPAASAIAAGGGHTLIVAGGKVLSCGWNSDGQLGSGNRTTRLRLVEIPGLSGVSRVAAGYLHSMALVGQGVRTWGDNQLGQVGNGSTADALSPVTIQLSGVTEIQAGGAHNLALRSDRTLWAWGNNTYGGLGDNTLTVRRVPQPVPGLSNVRAFSAGYAHSLARGDFSAPVALVEIATALSVASASAARGTVTLTWTIPLSSASAGRAGNYAVTVDGVEVDANAAYSAAANTTTLTVDGTLRAGARVAVRWSGLVSAAGAPVKAGAVQVVVR